jgi:hypothetical protein
MTFKVRVNGTRVDNISADTFMEAELEARIRYGLTAQLEITEVEP